LLANISLQLGKFLFAQHVGHEVGLGQQSGAQHFFPDFGIQAELVRYPLTERHDALNLGGHGAKPGLKHHFPEGGDVALERLAAIFLEIPEGVGEAGFYHLFIAVTDDIAFGRIAI